MNQSIPEVITYSLKAQLNNTGCCRTYTLKSSCALCPLFPYCLAPYLCHTFNKFLTFNVANAFFFLNNETSLGLIPDLAFSTAPHTAERAGICLQHQHGMRSQELFQIQLTTKHPYSQNTADESDRSKHKHS